MSDPLDLAAIRKALQERERPGRTHWDGCHLDPAHRDCLAWRLVEEVDRLRTACELAYQELDTPDPEGGPRWCYSCQAAQRTLRAALAKEAP